MADRFGARPERLGADKAYGSAALLRWLYSSSIEPHIPVTDCAAQNLILLTGRRTTT